MLKITGELREEHFFRMELLERQFYDAAFITPAKESYACYLRFPRSTVAALSGEEAVGFVNLFPVVDEVFRGLMRGTYNDSALTCAQIQDVDAAGDAPVHMFLSCIAVDRGYRRQGVTGALLRAATDGYREIERRCGDIVTDNVTEEGCRFSQRLGFEFVCRSDHGSSVYAMAYSTFVKNVSAL